jgi:hypothetical protein
LGDAADARNQYMLKYMISVRTAAAMCQPENESQRKQTRYTA